MKLKYFLCIFFSIQFIIISLFTFSSCESDTAAVSSGYIKWVDFGVTASALADTAAIDIAGYGSEKHCDWVTLLSVLAVGNGGDFSKYTKASLDKVKEKLDSGMSPEDIVSNVKLYRYYLEAYGAVLDEILGEYTFDGEKRYGICGFSPIADGYYYNHYDDFGDSRSFGYKRSHLGHDMLGSVGTPITAVEAGYVEACGWNMYGGWRIGIRSFDGKRYYYYAHLRKNHPYNDIYEGKIVNAGEVIGYLGMTGYSSKENVNNIEIPHLHFGVQLIFDSSQKDGNNQIWIDVYELVKFLSKYKMPVRRDDAAGEYYAQHEVIAVNTPD